jgi:hypothetical protein
MIVTSLFLYPQSYAHWWTTQIIFREQEEKDKLEEDDDRSSVSFKITLPVTCVNYYSMFSTHARLLVLNDDDDVIQEDMVLCPPSFIWSLFFLSFFCTL